MRCLECGSSKFDTTGSCEKCGAVSWEMQDKITNEEFKKKKREGKL